MKKITIILAFMLLATISTKATIWTVCNNGGDNQDPDFTNIQTAIDSAAAGDTLYVSGSAIEYNSHDGISNKIYVRKQLTLIGTGYNLESSSYLISKLYYILFTTELDTLGNTISSGANSIIMGFRISTLYLENGVNNVLINRNNINTLNIIGASTNYSTGNIIINNLIRTTSTSYISNNSFCNNIFHEGIIRVIISNSLISNNIFINLKPGSYTNPLDLVNCTVRNNIFYLSIPKNISACTIKNNILYYTGTDSSFNVSSVYNNIEGHDPLFVDVTTSSTSFNYLNDYHLQASSLGKNAGTDGTDIGIYGGSYPFPSGGPSPYTTSALPSIPQIIKLELRNAVVPKDSAIHINLKARISN